MRDGFGQGQGDRAHGAEIRRHVLAHQTVAPGRPEGQFPVFVGQPDRQTVDLGLDRIDGFFENFLHFGKKPPEFLLRKHVVETSHRDRVGDLLELLARRAADPLGGGVGVVEFGERRFELGEFPKERVVFVVGDLGRVHLVIETRVIGERLAQLADPLFRLILLHIVPRFRGLARKRFCSFIIVPQKSGKVNRRAPIRYEFFPFFIGCTVRARADARRQYGRALRDPSWLGSRKRQPLYINELQCD